MSSKSVHRICWWIPVVVLVGMVLMADEPSISPDILKIGITEEPKTLNIWLAGDANSRKILSRIYHPLYIYDPETLDLVPWLAEASPDYDPTTLCYSVKLRKARWSDGSDLTSRDVAFTGRFIQRFKIPRYASNWNFVKKIETPDSQTVKFYLKSPKAIFLHRTLTTPIVPEHQWAGVIPKALASEKPLTAILNYKPEQLIGSGPFVLKQWQRGSYIYMERNPHFFARGQTIGSRQLGPHIKGILFKIYGTTDVAVLALKKGAIDMFWWGVAPGYISDLKRDNHIRLYFSEKSAVYFMGFNLRTPPFHDRALRRACAFLIDKEFIISRILQGYGIPMPSIVPPGNRFWFCPDVPEYGTQMTREYRIKAAWETLRQAGYSWEIPPVDTQGHIVPARGLRLPDGSAMKPVTILTPPADYDPLRAMSGMMIQEWLREIGMPVFSKPMAFGSLLDQVKAKHEFDAFILGYGKLSLDPAYVGNFFHSSNDKPRGWNMSGYRNPEFDALAEAANAAMDPKQRQALVWEMQKMIITDVPYIPLYNPVLIEAIRTDRMDGWVKTLGGIGNTWSFCQVRPIPGDDDGNR